MSNNNNNLPQNQQNEVATYEPSRNVKQSYLMLRKTGYNVANRLQLHGLFSYSKDNDRLKFILAVLCELLLALILGYLVSDRYEFSILMICGAAFLIVSIDYIFCFINQMFVINKRQKLKNQKTLRCKSAHDNQGGYDVYVNALDAKYPDPKYLHYFLLAMIIFMVSARLYYFWDIADGSFIFDEIKQKSGTGAMAIQVGIIFMHLFIVWVHTTSTGYYLGYLVHTYWYKKPDRKDFYAPLDNGQRFNYPVVRREINLNNFISELQQDRHSDCQHLVAFNPSDIQQYIADGFKTDTHSTQGHHTPYHPHKLLAGDTPQTCIIQTYGFLDDAQLIQMVEAQTNPIAKYAIAIHGLDLQLDSLELDR